MSQTVLLHVDPEVYQALGRLADATGLSRQELLRLGITDVLHGAGALPESRREVAGSPYAQWRERVNKRLLQREKHTGQKAQRWYFFGLPY